MTQHVIVGTAGHIDHGKTRLVEALTGVDCDRWQEEKDRGITIDIGFAHVDSDDLQLGFVDVPGHERFLDNALAGLGGIRIMLLVVAADEGVKPQTREHLAICSLLSIERGLVALTKCDLVDAETRELASLEIEELLAETPFAGAEILPVSSRSGDGVAELLATLRAAAAELPVESRQELPARLPIDRAFHLKGLGVVVTGTLVAGSVAAGDTLQLLPGDGSARVRNVQVHGERVERAQPGQRTALQLTGCDLAELPRGTQLVLADAYATTTRLAAEIEWLPEASEALSGSTPVRFHLLTSEVVGRARPLAGEIAPGSRGIVEVQLSRPVVAVRGDRFVVRRPSPPLTLGGGRILDPRYRRRRGAALARAVEDLTASPTAGLRVWVDEARERGVEAGELARRLGWPVARVATELERLAAEQAVLRTPAGPGHGERWLTPATFRALTERATNVLQEYFQSQRLARGIAKAEAVERILPGAGRELAGVYLKWLAAQGTLVVDGDRIDLPGRTAAITDEESELSRRIVERFDAARLTPPSPNDLARELSAKPQIFAGVVDYLVDRGRLVRLPGGLIVSGAAIDRLAAELGDTDWEQFSVADFKNRFDLTRKWAIPLLEHLDSTGVTRRLGDRRQLVRGS